MRAKNVHTINWDSGCGDRLRHWVTKKFPSYGDAATVIGVTASNLSKYLGVKKEPSVEILLRFQRQGLSLDWVTTGHGSMELPSDATRMVLVMDGRAMMLEEAVDLIRTTLSARPAIRVEKREPEQASVEYVGNIGGVLDYLERTTKERSKQERETEGKRDGDSVLL